MSNLIAGVAVQNAGISNTYDQYDTYEHHLDKYKPHILHNDKRHGIAYRENISQSVDRKTFHNQ